LRKWLAFSLHPAILGIKAGVIYRPLRVGILRWTKRTDRRKLRHWPPGTNNAPFVPSFFLIARPVLF
jgi:hypothetical protein